MKWLMLLPFAAFAAHAADAADVRTVGQLTSARLTETSGIASSNRSPDVVWGINDSGNAPLLHAFAIDGSDLGGVRINQVRNHDWEDLASFVLDDTPYVLIADTGDNRGIRRTSWLLIVEEPTADTQGRFSGVAAMVARVPFRYEDGPRDCEAVAVNVASDRVLLVSKSDVPAAVYELPLTLVNGIRRPLVARRIAIVGALPRPNVTEMLQSPFLGAWRHQPTALDISRDDGFVAILTYQNLYLFSHAPDQDWGETFAATPRALPLPGLSQNESVAFVDDRVIVIAEGKSAAVLSIGPIGH